jgi:hypothetical protein
MNNKSIQGNQNHRSNYSGLYLFGRVIDRTRRHVPKDNPTTEIVTYLIQSNQNSKFYVDDYAPNSYYEIGDDISLNVYIKTYKRKNGEPSYTLNIQQNDFSRGEHF